MKNARRQGRVRTADLDRVGQIAGTPASGNDGDRHARLWRRSSPGRKPAFVPSASIEVSTISPAPNRSTSIAQATAS